MSAANRTRHRGSLALRVAILALIGAALTLAIPSSAAAASDGAVTRCKHTKKQPRNLTSKKAQRAVICLINKRRAGRGLAEMDRSRALRKAGQRHSRQMRRTNCFAHQCGGEGTLATRAARANYLPCGCSWVLGENIDWGKGRQGSPRRIVKGWMASAAHRGNILSPRFSEIGVGFLHGRPGRSTRGSGIYTVVFGDKA